MTNKILRSILSVAATVLIASLVIVTGVLYDYFADMQSEQLKDELSLAAAATEQIGETYLTTLNSDRYRLTLVAEDGTVIYDTAADAEKMENHLDREEIKAALSTGRGSSTRKSATLTEKTIYEAVKLNDGTVLRISVSRKTAGVLVLGMLQPILFIALAAIILSAILANRMAKRITEPLNQLDLEHPLENDAYEELSPLLNRINGQHRQIKKQLRELKRKKDEFNQITDNMQEGLVLLNEDGYILSINPAAAELFGTSGDCIGENFLVIDRRHDMSLAIEKAFKKGHGDLKAERNGREFQFDISRIESGGKTIGAVLLAIDITEQSAHEKIRREFSANVSHELKTPLQSIIGSAELIENGLVRPEDMPRFVGHIRKKATGLVELIEDLIRLSQLDEGNELPQEKVALSDITKEVFAHLKDTADKRNITLNLEGDSGNIHGVRRLLYEVIYNLCDNAVKYNTDGGKVTVNIREGETETVCSVTDTGIGIPPEHQPRVFERFYRVDKSHSEKSGGTGLGLSIVKHAVGYHGGTVYLESNTDGTKITVTLPKLNSEL